MAKKKYTLRRKQADKHLLYQWAVQDPDHEIEFAVQQYRKRRGRRPKVLREDFCGTALVASKWVKSHPKRRAIGLDLDGETLQWAREHNLKPLGKEARKRVDLRQRDVRTVTSPKADIIQAYNFSYSLLHPGAELVKYFRAVRRSLAPGGIFLLDSYGGWESQQPHRDRKSVESPLGTFGFVWEQTEFNVIDNRGQFRIHFEFAHGKRWKNAFSYDFRMYSLAELQDALSAAGFTNIQVLWDVEEDDDADCDYRPATHAENCPSWVAYVIADAEAAAS
jgi:SAM-dependent methyltransferase